jgi:hypothetical protein
MNPPVIPPEIDALHRALLAALRVDYFRPGMGDLNAWHDFLFVLQSLDDSAGGKITARDVHGAVNLMREENRDGKAKWSLRFAKILRDPEAFRDLVLLTRKAKRPRPPVEPSSRTAGDVTLATERDPAAENDPVHIKEHLAEFKKKMGR